MAKYFSIDEMTRSATATALGIDNTPELEIRRRLQILMDELLDPTRELWGAPLLVTSGYRCQQLNRVVGGAGRSQHLVGEAVDITTGSREGNHRLFEMLCAGTLEFDQLIDESNYAWLHLSYRRGGCRKQILHLP